MECLQPFERNKLLKEYIDKAKINVTHIYLAQLMKEGYVDYVLTVNFDNLLLRALALFNEFPATYDMAILKDLTTTAFKEKSIVFLHGQHYGVWLLNTPEEMSKVKEIIPPILHSIKSGRTWIFIGYSGKDPIFEHIQNLGRFDNGLYWVTYKDNDPNDDIKEFLTTPNKNAFIIKSFDADSFMLKLNNELGLEQPTILDRPFTTIRKMLDNIVGIDDQEHFKGVKERLERSKNNVDKAIQQFEIDEISLIEKKIIDLLIAEKYSEKEIEIKEIEDESKNLNNDNINSLLSGLYSNWGNSLGKLARTKKGTEAEELYRQAFEKFYKAIEIKPNMHEAFNNWGVYLGNLAQTKKGTEAEELYRQVFEKFHKAIAIKPDMHEAFNNWGAHLGDLAQTKKGAEAEELYRQAFEKYHKAIAIKPDYHEAFYNWGAHLGDLAQTKKGAEAEELYRQAFEKYHKAIAIKPDYHEAFYNWGNELGKLAQTKKGAEAEELYRQAFEKYHKAIEIKPDYHEAFYNWGNELGKLAQTKKGIEAEELYRQAFEKYHKAISIKPDDHEAFNNWGICLGNLARTKKGAEAKELYRQTFEKYHKAIEIKPDYHEAFYNWGIYLRSLAQTKKGAEAEELYRQNIEKYHKAIEFGGGYYNLACIYALTLDKEKALYYLDKSLENDEIAIEFVKKDKDWKNYIEDIDFINILEKHKNNE